MKYPDWEYTQLQTKVTDLQTAWVHLNSKLPEPSYPGERQGETPTSVNSGSKVSKRQQEISHHG